MPIIHIDSIIGIRNEGAILHTDCFDGELRDLTFDDIITDVAEGEMLYFCTKCNKAL